MRKIFPIALLLFLSHLFFAQIPVLETPVRNGDYKVTNDVVLQSLNYDVKITGNISTTVATMVFKNNSNRILEGRLTFPLPENVSVSGYALDINGKLRNAVPVEKEKAKEVFESIEKRRVDPGILEKVEGNNFRTRIYPITANGKRTVQITYNQELKKSGNNLQYFLPLDYKTAIPSFTLKTTVFENINTPQLEEKPDGSFNLVKNGNVWVAETTKTNYKTSGNLRINLPQNQNESSAMMQNASGNTFYFLANIPINASSVPKKMPETIGIIWDNSLSGLQRDHVKESELLDEYFKVAKNTTVKLALLNNEFEESKTFKINNGNWQELKTFLTNLTYDGGTDFGQLKNMKVDEYLLFSDGLSTFGDLNLTLNKPVYTIVSSTKANFSQMKFISLKTGGELLNINQNSPQREVRKLLFQNLKFLGIKDNPNLSEVYPRLPQTIDNNLVLSGITNQAKTTVTLLFGYENQPTQEKIITLNADDQTTKDWDISKFWAQKKISELELFEDQNKEEIKNLGKQFGIATNNTSLIVLENVQDYARYEIFPPEELRAEYDRIIKRNLDQRDARMTNIMEKAEQMTETLKKWWNTDFKEVKKYPKPNNVNENQEPSVDVMISSSPTPSRNSNILQAEVAGIRVDSSRADSIDEVVVAASGIRRSERRMAAEDRSEKEMENTVKGKITTIDVKSDQEYMKSFEQLTTAETIYNQYLIQRKTYIQTPTFYFDVAKLLFQNNHKKLGLKVLSSIADLDIENEELYKLLVYKLKEQNINDKQVWIARKILDWRPMDPQSYRDYALALEDDGKPQEALDYLYKILNKSYTQEIAQRDNGIEETIIMELNELISRNRNKLDISAINPKLIADLPVNIRVVLNWNKDNTDIDLWITDPNGEKCMYSHKETASGGRLSTDFTRGFGPEQFLLKKAIKGKYKIETNFYGETQVTLTGPTAIMAEIYINYATGKQERKLVVFQNQKKSKEGNSHGILIGEFEF
ncbi:VIT domain-containing protein [Kaistella sp.]|uniref:VIT domain-containing protein n=1 Tax=Kaistella sp. TaxID=2782235 RepID=UPI0035A146D6